MEHDDGYPELLASASWGAARVVFPGKEYRHPPTGLVQLRLIRRGSAYLDVDLGLGLRHVFTRPGDLLLTLGDQATTFRGEDARELTLLQVRPGLARTLLRQSGGHRLQDLHPLLVRPVRDTVIAELLRRLEDGGYHSASTQRWALGLIFAHLLDLARQLGANAATSPLSSQALAELLTRVEGDLAQGWTVDRLAAEVQLPRRTFAAAFKQAKGTSVHQYVLRLRADQAAALLTATDMPIADIALRVGFAHQAHMTRVLNRLLGRTPSQIRAER
jgi:AraC family transcriptional regulator